MLLIVAIAIMLPHLLSELPCLRRLVVVFLRFNNPIKTKQLIKLLVSDYLSFTILMRGTTMTTQLTTANNTCLAKSATARTLINIALISALTVSPVFASSYENAAQANVKQADVEQKETAQLNEEIGFGTGMVIGAILGGPVGCVYLSGVNNIE